uniref:RNase H type-1 domain-containing protein n=1 Tax=Cacopsylla melanoneura TaxID=428564 RepID=A0A8D8UMM8_9HEMI
MMNYVSKIVSSPFNPVQKTLFHQDMRTYKFTKSKPKPVYIRLRNNLEEFTESINTADMIPYVRIKPPWSNITPPVDLCLAEFKKDVTPPIVFQTKFNESINTKYPNNILCFTDGSKTRDVTNCAFSIDNLVSSSSLNPINTIFSAELLALYLCLEAIKESTSINFLVISDSKSALTAVSNIQFANPLVSKVYTTWEDTKGLGKNVTFMWCPSHCGIRGNETVDNAARYHNPQLNQIMLCTPEDFKPYIKSLTLKSWQQDWNNVSNTNKLKTIKPMIQTWQTSNQEKRYQEIVLTRMRIGHTRATHSYLFTRTDPPLCQCGEPVTVRHIMSCLRHTNTRNSLPTPPTLEDNTEGVKSLFKYLKLLNMYHLI